MSFVSRSLHAPLKPDRFNVVVKLYLLNGMSLTSIHVDAYASTDPVDSISAKLKEAEPIVRGTALPVSCLQTSTECVAATLSLAKMAFKTNDYQGVTWLHVSIIRPWARAFQPWFIFLNRNRYKTNTALYCQLGPQTSNCVFLVCWFVKIGLSDR